MSKQICILCRKPISDGIIINGKFICKCCEDRLVNSEVKTDFYEYYKECIKKNITEALIRNNAVIYQQLR